MRKLMAVANFILYPLLLSGCAHVTSLACMDEGPLDKHAEFITLPPKEQMQIFQKLRKDVEHHPEKSLRLRYALMLSMPSAPWHDDEKALALIDAVTAKGTSEISAHEQALALSLKSMLSERIRQSQEIVKLQQLLLAEQQNRDVLQTKLDALRAIERDPLFYKGQRR